MKKALWQIAALLCIELIIVLPIYYVNALTVSDVRYSADGFKADINWTTDQQSSGRVNYGTTKELGSAKEDASFKTSHSLEISPLQDNTLYYFMIEAENASGDKAINNNSGNFYSFTTLDKTPPEKIRNLTAADIGVTAVALKWDRINATDFNRYLIYRDNVNIANSTTNSYTDANVSGSKTYSYRASAMDRNNNEGILSDSVIATTSAPDTAKPVIANLSLARVTDSSATINWATDEDASSIIYYGETKSLGKEEVDASLVKEHSATITGLANGTVYYYVASSCDNSNNCANSTIKSFKGGADFEPPFIDVGIPSYHNKDKIDIEGKTEAYSTVRVYVNGNLKRQLISGASGSFAFYNVELGAHGTTNAIKIWSGDIAGNILEKEFSVSVDAVMPVLAISGIPAFTSLRDLTITGSVNEPATINSFVEYGAKDAAPPAQVTGLANGSIGKNSIEFSWDENNETDFDKYIIYRQDVGPIAATSSKSYATYTDVLVDSGKSYAYQVSAVDKSSNEGLKSNALTITTLPDGRVNITLPKKINISDAAKPGAGLNVSGSFNYILRLDKGDGSYKIKIIVADRANNQVIIENETLLDTNPLKIVNIVPRDGSFIYENFADEVTIEGDVKQDVIVNLYINKSDVGREDYTTATDSKGHFRFEEVDVTPYFSGSITPQNVPPDKLGRSERRDFDLFSRRVKLNFVAKDKFGRTGNESMHYDIGSCWSGNFSYNIMPLLDYQSPTFLSTERLAEGTEAIYFLVNMSYIGPGIKPNIESVSFQKACDDYIENDPKYNYSCKIMQSSCNPRCNQAKTVCYVTCPLSAIEGMDKWLNEEWGGFFKVINNELVFPFRARINYNYNYEGQVRREYQTTCFSTTYVVDNSKINFKDALPDWLLYDFVGWLNESIKTVDEWLDDMKDILEIVGTGCVVSFLTKFALQVYRRVSCHYDNIERILEKVVGKGGTWDNEDKCKACIEKETPGIKDWKSVKQDEMSDTCLKECQPTCSSAWKAEETNYQIYRWTCDRFFGHSAPSKWTETVNDAELYQKKQTAQTCKKDQSVMGQPIRAVKCKDIAGRYSEIHKTYTIDQECFEVRLPEDPRQYYVFDNLKVKDVNNDLYELGRFEQRPRTDSIYAVKQTEDNYLTAQPESCNEVCDVEKWDTTDPGLFKPFPWEKQATQTTGTTKEKPPEAFARCMPVSNCLALPAQYKKATNPDKEKTKVESATPKGYTSDCFYNPDADKLSIVLLSTKVVSDNPDERYECCCVNAVSGPEYNYYKERDVEKRGTGTGEKAIELKDMKWSYRYWKIRWEAPSGGTEYNPDRYIKERDQPACFGQNSWLREGFGVGVKDGKGNLLTIDPAKQWDMSFQCLAISQIYNRLMLIKNIMNALYNCLITVRTTGTADTGVCKELFSQYVCSLVWDIISYIQDGCMPGFGGTIDWSKSESQVAEAVSAGTSGLWKSVADSQQELMSEYGNAELTNLLGIGEEGMARKICLAAFGYDWDLDLENVIDVAYANTYASLVQAVFPRREYLTFDPSSLYGTYEYRASWLINPGCDIENYNVYLACVTPNEAAKYNGIDCSYQGDPLGSNCDCYNKEDGREEIKQFYDGRGLKQNVLEEMDKHEVISAPYRYDHLKFKLTPSHTIKKELREQCFPEGHEDGIFYFPIKDTTARDVVACNVDATTGKFGCEEGAVFWGDEGLAYFVGVDLDNDKDYDDERDGKTYHIGDTISAEMKVYKDQQAHCWMAQLRDITGNALPGEKGKRVYGAMIEGVGTYVYPTGALFRVTEGDLAKSTAEVSVTPRDMISYSADIGNAKVGTVTLIFIDGGEGDGIITLSTSSPDKYKIGSNGKEEDFTNCRDAGCYIDTGFGVILKITGVKLSGPKQRQEFDVVVSEVVSAAIDEVKWTLHLDIRNLKSQTGSCDEVIGEGYDKTAVAYKSGQEQKHDIPITITTKPEVGGRCQGDGSTKQDVECVCGDEKRPNCGKKIGEIEYRFCYKNTLYDNSGKPIYDKNSNLVYADQATCHAIPQCKQDGTEINPSLYPCDCDSNGEVTEKGLTANKDCSGQNKYLYCYDNDNDKIAECHDKGKVVPVEDKISPKISGGNTLIEDKNKVYQRLGTQEIEVNNNLGFKVYVTDNVGVTEVKVSAVGKSDTLSCNQEDKKECLWIGIWDNDQLSTGPFTIKIEAKDANGNSDYVEQKIKVISP